MADATRSKGGAHEPRLLGESDLGRSCEQKFQGTNGGSTGWHMGKLDSYHPAEDGDDGAHFVVKWGDKDETLLAEEVVRKMLLLPLAVPHTICKEALLMLGETFHSIDEATDEQLSVLAKRLGISGALTVSGPALRAKCKAAVKSRFDKCSKKLIVAAKDRAGLSKAQAGLAPLVRRAKKEVQWQEDQQHQREQSEQGELSVLLEEGVASVDDLTGEIDNLKNWSDEEALKVLPGWLRSVGAQRVGTTATRLKGAWRNKLTAARKQARSESKCAEPEEEGDYPSTPQGSDGEDSAMDHSPFKNPFNFSSREAEKRRGVKWARSRRGASEQFDLRPPTRLTQVDRVRRRGRTVSPPPPSGGGGDAGGDSSCCTLTLTTTCSAGRCASGRAATTLGTRGRTGAVGTTTAAGRVRGAMWRPPRRHSSRWRSGERRSVGRRRVLRSNESR